MDIRFIKKTFGQMSIRPCLSISGVTTRDSWTDASFGLDHCLVQTVGADSISALFGADMESAPTQYVAERMINAHHFVPDKIS
nr:hypothetical protein [uncultured Desulfobacter sp.]